MPLNKALQNRIDSFFVDYDTAHTPGCALGIILDGELVYARGYGLADLEQQAPITTDTVFHLASVSKQFTAACIALLDEAGKLALEDEVGRYIPYLPDAARALKLRHLVYMTNGLEDFYEVSCLIKGIPEDAYFSRENAIEIIQAADWLKFQPGESWSYGNTGYFLLGRIIEQVTGQSLANFAREAIFVPLGMAHTFFRDDRHMIIPRRANGYARAAFFNYQDSSRPAQDGYCHQREPLELTGAGQCWSTVNDLFRWDQNFYHNILGKGDRHFSERISAPGVLNDGTPIHYAFGQFVNEAHGCRVFYHEGGAPGANTVIYRVPEKRFSFICLANTSDFINTLFQKHGSHFYEDLAGLFCSWDAEKEPATPVPTGAAPEPSPVPSSEREAMAGMYADGATAHIWEVTPAAGGMNVRENFAAEFTILPAALEPSYAAESRKLRCTFQREGDLQAGPYSRIRVESGESDPPRIFQRFLSAPPAVEALQPYAGVYVCKRLRAGYRVMAVAAGVRLQNLDPRNDVLNVIFTPTIRDMFIARYPPALEWFVVHFRRDASEQIVEFVFRDEVPGRENWVFVKIAGD